MRTAPVYYIYCENRTQVK